MLKTLFLLMLLLSVGLAGMARGAPNTRANTLADTGDKERIVSLENQFRRMHKQRLMELPLKSQRIKGNIYNVGTQEMRGVGRVMTIAGVHEMMSEFEETMPFPAVDCCNPVSLSAVWKTAPIIQIDPTNSDGIAPSTMFDTLSSAFATWNSVGTQDLYSSIQQVTLQDMPKVTSADGSDYVFFAVLNSQVVLGVTYLHGVFDGPLEKRHIIEADMVLNDYFPWGDGTTNPNVVDVLNIAVHEAGHFFGMNHPHKSCTESSMFASAGIGETKKRSLTSDDRVCFCTLYNDATCNMGNSLLASDSSAVSVGAGVLACCLAWFIL
jgi:hypothetical protein